MNTEHILIPTDFSSCAQNALEYTLEFVKTFPVSRVILLHSIIYNDSAFIRSSEKEKENTIRYNTAVEKLEEWERYIKSKNGSFTIKKVIDSGSPVETIQEITKTEKADLIIMGTKGASGLREVIIGSYAANVIKVSEIPVMVIPERSEFAGFSDIVCTTDFHESEISALLNFLDFFKVSNSSVTLLNSDDDQDEQKRKVESFLEKITIKTGADIKIELISSSEVVKSVEKYVSRNSPDLIVTLGKHRNFWDKLFGEKVPEHLSFHTKVPLLSFPLK